MSDVFHYLTSDDLRLLAEKAKQVNYAAGETILSEGHEAKGIFVLRSGRVKIEKRFSEPSHTITTPGSGLSSRFYQSLALKLTERLRATTDNLVSL